MQNSGAIMKQRKFKISISDFVFYNIIGQGEYKIQNIFNTLLVLFIYYVNHNLV